MRTSKSVVFTIITVNLALAAFAQKEKNTTASPEARNAFTKAFPAASKVKWEKEKANYEVNFVQNAQTMSAVYDAKGNLQETEQDIKIAELPAGVVDYIKQNYKGATVKEAARITKANGEINYEAEVNKKDLVFDTKGKFIKEVKD
jgi:hypothetical protein